MNLASWRNYKIIQTIQTKFIPQLKLEPDFLIRLGFLCELFYGAVRRLNLRLYSKKMSPVLYDVSLTDLRILLVESEFHIFIHLPFVDFSDFICKVITSNMSANIDYVFNLSSELSLFQVL